MWVFVEEKSGLQGLLESKLAVCVVGGVLFSTCVDKNLDLCRDYDGFHVEKHPSAFYGLHSWGEEQVCWDPWSPKPESFIPYKQRVGLLVVTPFVSSPGDDLHLVIWFYLGKLVNAFGRGSCPKTKIIPNRKTSQKNLSYFKRVKCLPVAFKPFFPSSSFIKF